MDGIGGVKKHEYRYLSTKFLRFATSLDGFSVVVARNLNKTREWRKCPISCKTNLFGRIDSVGLLTLTEDR